MSEPQFLNPNGVKTNALWFKWALSQVWTQWKDRRAKWIDFWEDFQTFEKQLPSGGHLDKGRIYPQLNDKVNETPIDSHYFFQDAWAFEKIYQANPTKHVDVGSHYKFVSLLSRVVSTKMVDIRPLPCQLEGLEFLEGDITDLPFQNETITSLSSLCVVEHIGLGRYGDKIDACGTEKAMKELSRVLSVGGKLYVSVPIREESVVNFNAHRCYAEEEFLELCEPLRVVEKRYIYGNQFLTNRAQGFGTGCYLLSKEVSTVQHSN